MVVAGGGTGGHIIPNIALLNKLKHKHPDLEILYIGSKKGMERKMISELGWRYEGVSCGKIRRYFDLQNLFDIFKAVWGVLEAFFKIKRFNPDVVFCKGGYVSFPVAIGGFLALKPVILHESDVVPGLANQIAAHVADIICVSFEESRKHISGKRVEVTGNPVREELRDGDRKRALKLTGLSGKKPVVLVMGGSQGAGFVNDLIWKRLRDYLKEYEFIHLCGRGKKREDLENENGYFALEYAAEEMKDLYALADIIVTRSGANSLAEIAFLGKASVLVPLVKGSRGDQIRNAEVFAEENPSVVLSEVVIDLDRYDLSSDLKKVLKMRAEAEMKPNNAADKIVDLILEHAKT